jgi:hypothetical protein
MNEIIIMALILSVLMNIVQAISAEYSNGYNKGMKYAKDWDERVEVLENRVHEIVESHCVTNDDVQRIRNDVYSEFIR